MEVGINIFNLILCSMMILLCGFFLGRIWEVRKLSTWSFFLEEKIKILNKSRKKFIITSIDINGYWEHDSAELQDNVSSLANELNIPLESDQDEENLY